MASHAQAKQWAETGSASALGRAPTLVERQFVQAIALIESGYGAGWKGEGAGSNNMGAVQTRSTDAADSFGYTDTHPTDSGASVPYRARFKKYPTPEAGMADVARLLFQQMHVRPTSVFDVSRQMYDADYYEGFGRTRDERIANHARALHAALKAITAALNEPMPPIGGAGATPGPKAPEVASQPWSSSEFWSALLSALREAPAGARYLEAKSTRVRDVIRAYQRSHELEPDGLLGPVTLGLIVE